jgi:hypothetical protein
MFAAFFHMIRIGVRNAFLAGVQDAAEELAKLDREEPILIEARAESPEKTRRRVGAKR